MSPEGKVIADAAARRLQKLPRVDHDEIVQAISDECYERWENGVEPNDIDDDQTVEVWLHHEFNVDTSEIV